MAESSAAHRLRAWSRGLVFGGSAVALAAAAGMLLFSTFMYYDDEGYVLISLRNFAEHGRLYREVYTQYGPFPYVFYAALHALGLPFTHTAGRLLTLAAWSGAALASAALVAHATRRLALALATLASVFAYLWVMSNEPTHPGGLVALLTALLAWLGHRWIDRDRPAAWAGLIGAGVAALALTKINIGVFAAASALAWALLHHEHAAVRRWSRPLLAVGAAILPFALMRPLLATPWAFTFAAMFAFAAVMAVGATALTTTPRTTWRTARLGALAAGLVTLVVVGVVFARGTTPADLLEGILLRPIRHPVHFNLRFLWPAATPALAAAAVLAFVAARLLRRRLPARVDLAVALLRLAATAALVVALLQFPAQSPDRLVLAFALPWVWLFLWPLAGEDAAALAARRWLGLLFLGQCLHAFPVPGSQVAWGTFLVVPLAATGAWSAAGWLAARLAADRAALLVWPRRLLLSGAALLALLLGVRFAEVAGRYRIGGDLDLPGSALIRPPERTATTYQTLNLNAVVHCDTLFSLPGMFSFNLWSGLPTPTLANVTHWFSLLDDPEQRAIVRALETAPRVGVIVQRDHLKFLAERGFAPRGLLFDHLSQHFEKAFAIDGFEFWVQRGRTVAPLGTAQLFRRESATSGDFQLDVTVLTPPGARLARLEWLDTSADHPSQLREILDASNSRLEIAPLLSTGAATAAPATAALPATLPRLARLSFVTRVPLDRLVRKNVVLRLRDPSGQLIAEAMFAD